MLRRAGLLLVGMLSAAATAAPYAWIGTATSVIAIDVESDRVVATIPMGGYTSVEASPGRRFAYAIGLDHRHSRIIDTAALAPIATLNDARGFARFELHPTRDEAYVKLASDFPTGPPQFTQVWDTERHAVTAQLPAFSADISAVAFDTATGRGYFKHVSTSVSPAIYSILEIDLATRTALREFALPGRPGYGDLHSATRRLYVPVVASADGALQQVLVFDLQAGTQIAAVAVGGSPSQVRLHPSGARLYVLHSSGQASSVSMVDTASLQVTASIANGTDAHSIDVAPAGDRIYSVGRFEVAAIDGELRARTSILTSPSPLTFPVGSRFIGGSGAPAPLPPGPAAGLWWNPDESGWGIHLTQRNNTIFAAWFTYDPIGGSRWYMASSCVISPQLPCPTCVANTSCSGDLYEANGPTFFRQPFNTAAVQISKVGSLQLQFGSADSASMSYVVGERSRTVPIQRQVFRTGATPPPVDYTDLWWKPNESGWGLGITHQQDMMFLTWFVYEDTGRPIWYVASACAVKAGSEGCRGTLYRTSGPPGPFASTTFDPSQVQVTAVGTIDVSFTDPNNGFISYNVDGVFGSKTITRQLF